MNNVTEPVNRINPPPTPKKGEPQSDKNTSTKKPKGQGPGNTSGGYPTLKVLLEMVKGGLKVSWGDWIYAGGNWGNQPDFQGIADDFNHVRDNIDDIKDDSESDDEDNDEDDD